MQARNSVLGSINRIAATAVVYHLGLGKHHSFSSWKDLPAEWEVNRGKMYGCGFGPIALGEGVIDVAGVFEVLKDGAAEYSILEVGGDENLLKSYAYLKSLGAE